MALPVTRRLLPICRRKQYTANSYVLNRVRVSGFSPANLPNADLAWEATKALDAGFDLGILGNRVTITADYYNKKTEKLLFQVALAFHIRLQHHDTEHCQGTEPGS